MFRFRTNPEFRAPLTAGGSSTFGYLLAAGGADSRPICTDGIQRQSVGADEIPNALPRNVFVADHRRQTEVSKESPPTKEAPSTSLVSPPARSLAAT